MILCAGNGEPLLDSNDRPTEARAFFRPDEINVLDNWHTTGLRGSGSNSFTADNVTLDSYRIATVEALRSSPLSQLPIYRFPRFGYLALPIGAIAPRNGSRTRSMKLWASQSPKPQLVRLERSLLAPHSNETLPQRTPHSAPLELPSTVTFQQPGQRHSKAKVP